jgi:hypothetical protein
VDPGNGCYGDPPGYPTYFTRSIYTQYGNTPRRGPVYVITYGGTHYAVKPMQLDALYKPLPLAHPRVQAWIAAKMTHLAGCYADDHQAVKPLKYGKPDFFIFPVPSYELRVFSDDARFSSEWRMKERTAVDQWNHELMMKAAKLATVDNSMAVRAIRKFYPEFATAADAERIVVVLGGPAPERPGDWWEREAARPSAEGCKPPSWLTRGHNAHRDGGYCQHCGRDLPTPRNLSGVNS